MCWYIFCFYDKRIDIDIINIEAWKKFNIDVSESGGCPEWDLHLDYEDDDIYEYENEICHIFWIVYNIYRLN